MKQNVTRQKTVRYCGNAANLVKYLKVSHVEEHKELQRRLRNPKASLCHQRAAFQKDRISRSLRSAPPYTRMGI
ncbi:hypothetical protein LDENG_00160350 [Lucifuga dentata]|nr:hypothetical protein LDENG_00160350 [Lucifuga dentata]